MQITTATALLFDLCLAGEHRRMMLLRWPPIGFILRIPSLSHKRFPAQGVVSVAGGKKIERKGKGELGMLFCGVHRGNRRSDRPSTGANGLLWQWMWPTSSLPTQRTTTKGTIELALGLPLAPSVCSRSVSCAFFDERINQAPQLCCQMPDGGLRV